MIRFSRLLLPAGILLCLLATPHAFAQTNEVLGCGDNSSGQLGDFTTTERLTLTPAFSISGIKAIACGYNHTLVLDSTSALWAWGYNGLGQLGTGDTVDRWTPVFIGYGFKAIAAGAAHSLALDVYGRVWAWGDNDSGQLGTGDYVSYTTPQLVTSLYAPIKAIACGGLHSLMLDQAGNLYGCGYNGNGQLGLGDNNDRSLPTYIFTSGVKAMAAGFAHTLIQTNINQVFAAGLNDHGELGDGTTTDSNTFVACTSTSARSGRIYARSLGAGHFHSLVVGLNGSVWAWGYNGYGQLGLGDTTDRLYATQMPRAAYAKAVTGGERHTLVLSAGGKVLATGYNSSGQLGDGTQTDRSSLTPVKNASFIGSIAAGSDYSVLFKPFTRSLATGSNSYGQLGLGGIQAITQTKTPRPMAIGGSIIAVSACPAGWHSLLLRADGTVWACGYNAFGQLGNGTTTNSNVPVQVLGPGGVGYLQNIIAIAAGEWHSMALAADGTVYTWGDNAYGELGLGDNTGRLYPVQAPGQGGVTAIACGGLHSLLLDGYSYLWDCGDNEFAQLGLGDFTDRSSFTLCSTVNGYEDVTAGARHSLFLSDGIVCAFGDGKDGQLGDGYLDTRSLPYFEEGTQAIAVAAGQLHTLHLNALGEVYGTGDNSYGELGLGDTSGRENWTRNTWAGIIGIACGGSHSLFLDGLGDLYACGQGAYGQLGNGYTGDRSSPTIVPGAPLTISMAGGWGHTLILTAPLIQVASVKLSSNSVVGGTSTTGTVTLNGLAGAGGQTVYLSCDSNLVSLPSTVTVTPTSKSASFPINTSSVSTTTVVHIFASLSYTVSTKLTLTP